MGFFLTPEQDISLENAVARILLALDKLTGVNAL